MLHHKIWSSQIRTTLCEEHSESPIRHRLKLPKPLCDSWSDQFLHFGPTEIIKLIWVFNLGATDFNFSVTLSCCNWTQLCISVPPSCSTRSHRQGRAIYRHGQNFGNFSELLRPRNSSLCHRRSPDRLLVASRLLSLVSAAVNGFRPRRCRRSEFITKLGYGLDHCAILVWFLAHCILIDSCHDWNNPIHSI